MPFSEENAVNLIAAQERAIAGIKDSFGYAKNPDVLQTWPAVLHYIPTFTSEPRAHHNAWTNTITLQSILCVAPRQTSGGKLKFLENAAIPFGEKWRSKFQDDTVITNLLSQMGAVKFFLTGATYGAGGPLLTVADVEFIGWIASFSIVNS